MLRNNYNAICGTSNRKRSNVPEPEVTCYDVIPNLSILCCVCMPDLSELLDIHWSIILIF